MGLFSDLVSFVESIVSAVVTSVTNVFGGGTTGILIATLAVLVVEVILIGPAAFTTQLATPWVFLQAHVLLCSIIASVFIQVISLISPTVGYDLGYVAGLLTFVMIGLDIAALYNPAIWSASQAFAFLFPASVGLTATQISLLYAFVSDTLGMSIVLGIAAGNTSFIAGVISGFFAIPSFTAKALDTVVSAALAATSSLWYVLGAGLLLYAAVRDDDNPSTPRGEPYANITH